MQSIIKNKLLSGIILIALGVLLVIAPNDMLNAYVCIIGGVLLFGALLHIGIYFLTKKENRAPLSLVLGFAAGLIGLFFLVASGVVIGILPVIFGVVLILNSLLDLVIGIRLPIGRVAAVILSLIGLVLGVFVLANPQTFANFIAQIIGASLIYEGVIGIGTALLARRAVKNTSSEGRK